MLDVQVVETSSLGDRSYLAHDGESAAVIDPQRDIDRILDLAGRLGVRITWVLETHVHNDYVSGGLHLARLTGARYGVAAADDVSFDRVPLRDGDVLKLSAETRIRVVGTPGHTFHHLSYILDGAQGPVGVFTGGSLLFGTTGRTDLLGRQHSAELARRQRSSTHRLARALPAGASVWPTHGFGSFCSSAQTGGDASTIGRERQVNPALLLAETEFVHQTLAGLDDYPAYYAHMGIRNMAGPEPIDLTPIDVAGPAELRRRINGGEWVVDLRSRKAYAHSHLAGTVSLGLDGPMATWLGWLIDWGTPITLLGGTSGELSQAQRELARIGVDRPAAAATGDPSRWAGQQHDHRVTNLVTASFADLAAELRGTVDGLPMAAIVLDVRQRSEWQASHIRGAVHIPLPELRRRLDELPTGPVWVHCRSGYRAAAAASLLARAHRTVVLIDDAFDHAGAAGIPMVA
jgi:glyoxylase-like metal-dependent hydrolase (beta-lactamase superfamily II)/rhodanese-related sulfurtransferase